MYNPAICVVCNLPIISGCQLFRQSFNNVFNCLLNYVMSYQFVHCCKALIIIKYSLLYYVLLVIRSPIIKETIQVL